MYYTNNLVNERNTLRDEIWEHLPENAKGNFLYGCCNRSYKRYGEVTHPKAKKENGFTQKCGVECPTCIDKIFIRTETDFSCYYKDGNREWVRDRAYDSKGFLFPYSFKNIRELLKCAKEKGAKIEKYHKKYSPIWREQPEYETVKNILSALDIETFTYEEDKWWERREFSQIEVDWLKEHRLFEEFTELNLKLNIQFRQMTKNILEMVRERMSGAGTQLIW